MEVIDDKLLSSLLPYISSGLEQGAATAYREATLMVVVALCSRTGLRKELLRGVVNSALRNIEAGPDAMRLVLMTLAHMAHTQPSLTLIPSKALKCLVSSPSFLDVLTGLGQAELALTPLLRLLTTSLVTALATAMQKSDPQ
ncbi:BP28CT domain-containing protein, partial [Haematococcus lacustris]